MDNYLLVQQIAEELERSIKKLLSLPNSTERVAVAMRVFGTRGAEVLSAIEECARNRIKLKS